MSVSNTYDAALGGQVRHRHVVRVGGYLRRMETRVRRQSDSEAAESEATLPAAGAGDSPMWLRAGACLVWHNR